MSGVHDETMALTVTEATMQDWQAAVTVMKQSPMSFCIASLPAPHPVMRRPRVGRPASTLPAVGAAKRTAVMAPHVVPAPVGGARTVYWLALAAALAVMTVL